jgi:hypothetical protein
VRWPAGWRDPAALDLVKGTPLGCLLFSSTEGFEKVIARARRDGMTICGARDPASGVQVVNGEWPGIRTGPERGGVSSGPTGAPWIDSNGWLVRLALARRPDRTVWVTADAPKSGAVVPLSRHLVALADGAAHGGRWVVSLDQGMAEGLAAANPQFTGDWKKLMCAIAFFQEHEEWSEWPVHALLAVVSSFSGEQEFFSHEVLNLTARTNVSYRILEKDGLRPEALVGLRAVVYPDSDPPSAELRQMVLGFAATGGLLITGPKWGKAPGTRAQEDSHPRYAILKFGKGAIAVAYKDPDDPYEVAQDAQVLLSHRYDLVRFYNGFGMGSYFTLSPDGGRALVHAINYAGGAGSDPVSVRIAGRFRSARLWSPGSVEAKRLEMRAQKDAVEVHLPPLAVYGGIELEV